MIHGQGPICGIWAGLSVGLDLAPILHGLTFKTLIEEAVKAQTIVSVYPGLFFNIEDAVVELGPFT